MGVRGTAGRGCDSEASVHRSVGLEDLKLLPGGLNPMPAKEFPHGP